MFVFFEFYIGLFKIKVMNDTGNELVFSQDMAVGYDLEFLLYLIIKDPSPWQGVAIQITKIGNVLMQFRPKLIVLARVRPDSSGRLNC